MSCLLTSNVTRPCEFIVGGAARLWLANKAEVQSASPTTGITMSGAAVMYEVEFEPNTGAFTNQLTVSNGQKYVTQGIAFKVAQNDSTITTIAPQLALGKFLALVQHKNGRLFLLGDTGYGLQATVTSLSSGLADGDFSGLDVSMENGATTYAQVCTFTTASIPV